MSFQECLELHKLTVFSADTAKRQRFYIQQVVRKPQRATVWQHILLMGVLNDYIRHLPTLKDNPKAVRPMKKRNIPFGKADLATIMLASVPMLWQNQYNLNHSTVSESLVHFYWTLRPSSKSWLRSTTRSSRQKIRLVQSNPKPRVTQSARHLGGQLVESQRRAAVRSYASIARPKAVPTRPTTPWTAIAMTAIFAPWGSSR